MATPFAHGLFAVAGGFLLGFPGRSLLVWVPLVIGAAVAPDLDFLPGIIVGDVNRFHHGVSHSLGAVALFGIVTALCAAVLSRPPLWIGLAAAALYASHLLLDFLTVDTRAPYGQPLFWPLSHQHFAMSDPPLYGIRHASADGSILSFFIDVFSKHNLIAVIREVLFLGPTLAVTLLARSRLTWKWNWGGRTTAPRPVSTCADSSTLSRD